VPRLYVAVVAGPAGTVRSGGSLSVREVGQSRTVSGVSGGGVRGDRGGRPGGVSGCL